METEEELRRSARCREKAYVNVSQGGASGGGNGGRGGLGRPIFRGRRRGPRRGRCRRRGASPVFCGDGGGRRGAVYWGGEAGRPKGGGYAQKQRQGAKG